MGALFVAGIILIGAVLLIGLVMFLAYEARTGFNWKKLVVALVLLLAAPVATWWTLYVAVPEITRFTKREVLTELASPDGAYTAVLYRQQADGPTRYRTFIAVAKGTRVNHADVVFTVEETPPVEMRWQDARTLRISATLAVDPQYRTEMHVRTAEQRWNDVDIEYQVTREGVTYTNPAHFLVPSPR